MHRTNFLAWIFNLLFTFSSCKMKKERMKGRDKKKGVKGKFQTKHPTDTVILLLLQSGFIQKSPFDPYNIGKWSQCKLCIESITNYFSCVWAEWSQIPHSKRRVLNGKNMAAFSLSIHLFQPIIKLFEMSLLIYKVIWEPLLGNRLNDLVLPLYILNKLCVKGDFLCIKHLKYCAYVLPYTTLFIINIK